MPTTFERVKNLAPVSVSDGGKYNDLFQELLTLSDEDCLYIPYGTFTDDGKPMASQSMERQNVTSAIVGAFGSRYNKWSAKASQYEGKMKISVIDAKIGSPAPARLTTDKPNQAPAHQRRGRHGRS